MDRGVEVYKFLKVVTFYTKVLDIGEFSRCAIFSSWPMAGYTFRILENYQKIIALKKSEKLSIVLSHIVYIRSDNDSSKEGDMKVIESKSINTIIIMINRGISPLAEHHVLILQIIRFHLFSICHSECIQCLLGSF